MSGYGLFKRACSYKDQMFKMDYLVRHDESL